MTKIVSILGLGLVFPEAVTCNVPLSGMETVSQLRELLTDQPTLEVTEIFPLLFAPESKFNVLTESESFGGPAT